MTAFSGLWWGCTSGTGTESFGAAPSPSWTGTSSGILSPPPRWGRLCKPGMCWAQCRKPRRWCRKSWCHQGCPALWNGCIRERPPLWDPIARIRTPDGREKELPMLQQWPVRQRRPYAQKLLPKEPMVTGQRVIDTLFSHCQRGALPVCRGLSVPGKRWGSTSWPSGRTRI